MEGRTLVIFNIESHLKIYIFGTHAEPRAPKNVQLAVLNSTHVRVMWTLLSVEEARGWLHNYTVTYSNGPVTHSTSVPPDQHLVVLGGLTPGANYSVHVSATNSAGAGEQNTSTFVLPALKITGWCFYNVSSLPPESSPFLSSFSSFSSSSSSATSLTMFVHKLLPQVYTEAESGHHVSRSHFMFTFHFSRSQFTFTFIIVDCKFASLGHGCIHVRISRSCFIFHVRISRSRFSLLVHVSYSLSEFIF